MNKKDNNIKTLLNEYQEKIKRLEEKQKDTDQKVELQRKKSKLFNLIMIFLFIFISGVTSVASYSIGANSVGYTPRDSNWNVENTKEAIDDLYNSLGSSLVGSVYSYMGVTAPFGYLACDGSTYNIEDYPRLANHINRSFGSYNYFGGDGETTFAVPDLRGEFLRGTGTATRNTGTGLAVGTHQEPTRHVGAITGSGNMLVSKDVTNRVVSDYDLSYATSSKVYIGTSSTYSGTVNNTVSYSARPTNTAVLYIIKY